ncbi:glycosyltransferase family 4 protein [Streptomyces niveus]|uniref:D-inositol 3-phosphate glycosyltransferase n=1 Tax=Streptomyces niveus TaxID=193462 RepID=A0ABZ2A348_STRNV|nr:glycosyltransferase family 4 protein [Streptomyces niveus]
MKITFLLFDAYGISGTIRTTANLATALAERHHVEIVSCYRTAERMAVPVDPRVRVRDLVDLRPDARDATGAEPALQALGAVCPYDTVYASRTPPSALGEQRLARFLRRTDSEVVIATRPYLMCFLAEHGRTDAYLRIGQEHLTRASHGEELRRELDAALDRLDAFVTVSEGDALAYDRALPVRHVLITHIPNCCPAPEVEAATGTSRIVVAAGRLVPAKRHDRLIGAFAKVAARHPDWSLRIYGSGPQQAALRRRIDELGLHAHVFLMGSHTPIDTEWAKGAIAAVSSDTEAFGMPIVEAMRLGVPVVATNCDYGPREIISHGRDGHLVPAHGPVEDHLADALCRLIGNDAERFRMAEMARRTARHFLPDRIARQYEALIEALIPDTDTLPPPSPARPPSTPLRRRASALAERLHVAALLRKELPHVTVDCRAAEDGSLVLRVPTRELAPAAWRLEMRPRDAGTGEPVSLPFRVGSSPDTGPQARLVLYRGGRPLAEGHWDVHLRHGTEGRSRRVHAGRVETSRLVGLALPHPSGAGWASTVPYATADGHLALRTWNRPGHAELATVTATPEDLTLTGTLHGAETTGRGYRLTVRLRDANGPWFHTHCRLEPDGEFAADIPLDRLADLQPGRRAVWDIALTPYAQGRALRPARLFGDLPQRSRIDHFPTAHHAVPPRTFTVQPHLTADHSLALRTVFSTRPRPADGPAVEERPEKHT